METLSRKQLLVLIWAYFLIGVSFICLAYFFGRQIMCLSPVTKFFKYTSILILVYAVLVVLKTFMDQFSLKPR